MVTIMTSEATATVTVTVTIILFKLTSKWVPLITQQRTQLFLLLFQTTPFRQTQRSNPTSRKSLPRKMWLCLCNLTILVLSITTQNITIGIKIHPTQTRIKAAIITKATIITKKRIKPKSKTTIKIKTAIKIIFYRIKSIRFK